MNPHNTNTRNPYIGYFQPSDLSTYLQLSYKLSPVARHNPYLPFYRHSPPNWVTNGGLKPKPSTKSNENLISILSKLQSTDTLPSKAVDKTVKKSSSNLALFDESSVSPRKFLHLQTEFLSKLETQSTGLTLDSLNRHNSNGGAAPLNRTLEGYETSSRLSSLPTVVTVDVNDDENDNDVDSGYDVGDCSTIDDCREDLTSASPWSTQNTTMSSTTTFGLLHILNPNILNHNPYITTNSDTNRSTISPSPKGSLQSTPPHPLNFQNHYSNSITTYLLSQLDLCRKLKYAARHLDGRVLNRARVRVFEEAFLEGGSEEVDPADFESAATALLSPVAPAPVLEKVSDTLLSSSVDNFEGDGSESWQFVSLCLNSDSNWKNEPMLDIVAEAEADANEDHKISTYPQAPPPPPKHSQTIIQNPRSKTCAYTRDTLCLICLDAFQPSSKIRILPCSHAFHACCVDLWLVGKSFCLPSSAPMQVQEQGGSDYGGDDVSVNAVDERRVDAETVSSRCPTCRLVIGVEDFDVDSDSSDSDRDSDSGSDSDGDKIIGIGSECDSNTDKVKNLEYKMKSIDIIPGVYDDDDDDDDEEEDEDDKAMYTTFINTSLSNSNSIPSSAFLNLGAVLSRSDINNFTARYQHGAGAGGSGEEGDKVNVDEDVERLMMGRSMGF